MKKKYIAIIFLCLGIVLVCLSIVLAIIAAVNKDIIGGYYFSSFALFFVRGNNGIYFYLHLCGIISLIAAAIIALKAKKHKNK